MPSSRGAMCEEKPRGPCPYVGITPLLDKCQLPCSQHTSTNSVASPVVLNIESESMAEPLALQPSPRYAAPHYTATCSAVAELLDLR